MRTPAALLLLVLLSLVACAPAAPSPPPAASSPPPVASGPPSAVPSEPTTPAPSASTSGDPLLTVATRGGHCRQGPCDRTIAIERDGRVHLVAPEAAELGTLPDSLLQPIQQQLSLADFEALGSRPFTGECPVNFDGQEFIYTFYGSTGPIRLASCEVELDPGHPLFVAIEAAVAAVAN